MNARFSLRHWAIAFGLGCVLLPAALVRAHESPVDHVEREFDLSVKDGQLLLSYRLRYADRGLLLQIHQMDTNADGRLTDEETTAFFTAQAAKLAGLFTLQLEGKTVKFQPAGPMRPDARLGQTYEFSAPLGALAAGRHPGMFIDGYSRMYPGSYRWRRAGEGAPDKPRVEPLTTPEAARAAQHAPWLELKFEIVVP